MAPMNGQLTFEGEGFEEPAALYPRPKPPKVPGGAHGLFLALQPGAERPGVERAVAPLRELFGVRGNPVIAQRLHVTMADLGTFAEPPAAPLVDAILQALAGLALPAVDICFDTVMRFKGNGALVLRESTAPTPLTGFRDTLAARLDQARLAFDPGGVPHMTLGYGGAPFSSPLAEPLRWVARELVLIHTLIGQRQHRRLAHWPLQPMP